MSSINRWVGTGRLTRDPSLKTLPSGDAVCEFSIALNSRAKKDGEWVDHTDFIDIVAYGNTAENVAQYMGKGRMIGVDGRLRHERWEKDGQKRSKIVVVANVVQFLDSKDGERERAPEPQGAPMDAPPI